MSSRSAPRSVALVTLGCARNEVDSEELAARLEADGWTLADTPAEASVVLVNTCGFIEAAKKDSIDTVLEAADLKAPAGREGGPRAVVAVGCLAERYGENLAEALPEADAVLGFDDYPEIAARLRAVVAGERHVSHVPRDRRKLLPVTPVDRSARPVFAPGHGEPPAGEGAGDGPGARERTGDGPGLGGPRTLRRRLDRAPVAPLKLASGCDRRCSFCAIPSFRGAFLSRRPTDVLAEARWLATQGVRELVLVSENSTSYGKDLGDLRLLESLLPELAAVDGIDRVRVSYLQPAEMRPGLVTVMAGTRGIVPYFDLSFQHASPSVLRRMRRFGGTEDFLGLLDTIRREAPDAGIRSNFIVGFPGETEEDVAELEAFLLAARLDAAGVFAYSDEDGTEAAGYPDKVDERVVRERADRLSRLAEEVTAQRAEERVGALVEVLVEGGGDEEGSSLGRAAHQAPEVDGTTTVLAGTVLAGTVLAGTVLTGGVAGGPPGGLRPGTLVRAKVVAAEGVDLVAELVEVVG